MARIASIVRTLPTTMALAAVVAAIVAAVSAAPAAAQSYTLGDQLCLDISGTLPDYGTNLPAAGAGSPRPMYKKTMTSRCNDGSPAVFYARRAPAGSPNANRWIVFIDGGGNCGTADECLERWCSYSPEVFSVAGKMSSLGAPALLDPPNGILSRNAANRFSDWNHVLLHYCSSDSHIGSAAPKTVLPDAAGPYAGFDFEIRFDGEAIVNELFTILRNGPTIPDDGIREHAVPDLSDAELIFAGESAGESGKRQHLDRVAALLAADGVAVVGAGDASFGPALYDALNWGGAPFASYDDMMLTYTEPRLRLFWEVDDTALDASCLASGVPVHFCYDSIYLAENEISTRSFLRADLTDPMGADRYINWGFYANDFELARATRAMFSRLPAGWGWFGPHCNQHVAIQARAFRRTTMLNGTGRTFHDELWNWYFGLAGPKRETQSDANLANPYDMSLLCF